jgi:hypothetical protein
VNPVACENTLPGDPPSDWQPGTPDDPSIVGFATSMSVNAGQTESFKISTPSTGYHIDILRLGYYGGDGARMIQANIKPSASLPQHQPGCLVSTSTGEVDCGNWGVSASWTVPANAVSGVYVAHLVRDDASAPSGDASHIVFVVRNDASHSAMLVQTSDATWEAYNQYDGNSLYTCVMDCPPGNSDSYTGAAAVSYNRPFFIPSNATFGSQETGVWWAEYPMLRFLEENGYDVSYTSESQVEASPSLLLNHKLFMSSGHDEYWSAGQRSAVTAALAAGVNLAFFSGNEMFWKTRWGNSIDGSNTPYRTLTTYKETNFNQPMDPQDPPTWTGTWRDPRFSPPADGGQPENAVTGQYSMVDYGTTDITVPYQYSKLRFWRNTSVASLSPGQTQTLAPNSNTLGHEWDVDADNGFRPGGEFDMSSTTVSGAHAFTNDYGSNENDNATVTHHLTLYRAPSGALVFGAGTIQWAWGLDPNNPLGNNPDPTMQQATVNLFADMGIQPATLIAGLVPASGSTDTTPPTSTISNPTAGSSLSDGSAVTVTGSATDKGGGVVAGVEVSTDGGTTWHPATLTTAAATTVSWSYSWVAHGYPKTTIESRAVDDSANIETPSDATSVTINCPCSIWGNSFTPLNTDAGDPGSIEVGFQFKSDSNGFINGIRFYKASTNTGTHVGSLWTSTGTLLAQATFTNESASGWQTVNFLSPVAVTAGTTYVAGYFAPTGHYSSTPGYFYPPPSPPGFGGGIVDSGPLHAIRNATSPDGLYSYGSSSTFPTSTNVATNYWVDVLYAPGSAPTAPGQVTGVAATPGNGNATVSWTAPSNGGSAITSYTITPYIGSTAQTPTILAGSPPGTSTTITGLSNGTTYTFTVSATNSVGTGPASPASNPVTPATANVPGAPTSVSASPASSQALVSWTAPANNGGSSITAYTITPFIGSTAQTPLTVSNASATSATLTGLTNGTAYTFTVAAINGVGTGAPSTASSTVTPEDTVFDFNGTPIQTDSGDSSAVTVGAKFTSTTNGTVTGIRFLKSAANIGTHIGSLWSAGGTLLAEATFTSETATGWQTVLFSSPVSVSAGTTYVASYLAPNGHYAASQQGFASAVTNGPLTAVGNATSVNGVYAYGGTSTFPTSAYNATNYWVDVLFQPGPGATVPGQPTGVSASGGNASATVSWTDPSSGGSPITSYTVTPYIGSTAQTPTTVNNGSATSTTVTGLTNGTAYTFTVSATNAVGTGAASAQSNAVTPTGGTTVPGAPTAVTATPASSQALVSWTAPASNGGASITGYTITPFIGSTAQTPTVLSNGSATSATVTGLTNGTAYAFTVAATNSVGTGAASTASAAVTPEDTILDFNGTPIQTDSGDTTAVNVGVKFTSTANGSVTGIRFLKSAANTGTHVGSLWTAGGTLLAQATFSGETASGWQTVNFSSPVAITAGTTYVASYLAPNGHYSASQQGFASAVINGPLTAVGNATSVNGVYAYGGTSTFPTSAYNATSYWVDVLFAPGSAPTAPGQPTGVSATTGSGSATVSWTAPSNGGSAITSYTITPYIGSTAQTPTVLAGSPPGTSTTITGLTNGTAYTFTVSATNSVGTGPASAASNSITPAAAPAQVTGVSATAGSGGATVSWTAPSNGGSPITSYTITPYIGSIAQTATVVSGAPPGTSTTITGLTNGTAYTFTVAATNGVGTGPASAASNSVTPVSAPAQVTGVSATAGNGSASVSWTAPSNGGSAITSYTITPYIGSTAQTATVLAGSPPASSTTITGLTNGTTYTFTVSATNSAGPGPASAASNSITPAGGATVPGAPTGVTASPATTQALVTWTAPNSNGGSTIISYTITPFVGSTAQTPFAINSGSATSATVTGLTNGSSYTFTVKATNSVGTGAASTASSAVVPEDSIFDFTGTPIQTDSGDTSAVNLGVKFTSTVNGSITGIRFLKSAANTGTHVGSLWTAGGTLLAQATFSAESPSGWQSVLFSSPVAITAGTTYVASYLAPNGHYSASQSAFSSAVTNGPLTAVANGTSVNGVYAYGATSTFPTSAYNATSYWVDVLLAPGSAPTAPGQVTGVSAATGNASATVSWTAPSNGGSPITSYTITPYIGSTAQTATVLAGSPPGTSTTITGLTNGTAYTFTVSATNSVGTGPASAASNSVTPAGGATVPGAPTGVTASPATTQALVTWTAPNSNGGSTIISYTITPFVGSTAQTPFAVSSGTATSATVTGLTNGTSYTFTVKATNSVGTGAASAASSAVIPEDTIFDFSGTPIQTDSGDTAAVNLGVKFTSTVTGSIIGIRFLKSAANTGTHVASLWTASGTLLAQATFTSESPSGWQTVLFSSPVAITAGTTYVASYLDPSGHYSASQNAFSSAVTNGPLTAVANGTSANGVYAYSNNTTFPGLSYNATNYWVDVLFSPN